jgi:6-pyruvoyl-tetrahydropterin synthase
MSAEAHMDVMTAYSARFDASHYIKGWAGHDRVHGHSFEVLVVLEGDINPATGIVRGGETLKGYVDDLVRELNGQDLGDMLPGVTPGPTGLAAYFMERLAIWFPTISTVTVRCSDGMRGGIKRSRRQ